MKNTLQFLLLMLGTVFYLHGIAQNNAHIIFTCSYPNKNDSDRLKLFVQNISSHQTYYYAVGVEGYTNSGWDILVSDINSLGQNEFLALKKLIPKAKRVSYVSKKRIFYLFDYKHITKIRFSVMYYDRPTLKSNGAVIYLPPTE